MTSSGHNIAKEIDPYFLSKSARLKTDQILIFKPKIC